jgi:hypothetical protein
MDATVSLSFAPTRGIASTDLLRESEAAASPSPLSASRRFMPRSCGCVENMLIVRGDWYTQRYSSQAA